jgi:murein DD-endopeptidase MepM/ murein hydrolase activator NlpD
MKAFQKQTTTLWAWAKKWLLHPRTSIFRWDFWRSYFSKPENEVTLVLLTKQHLEVQKVKLSPGVLLGLKVAGLFIFLFCGVSSVFFVDYLIKLPQNAVIRDENRVLRSELSKIQYHLDTLQTSMDRMARFDQKLRALTEVDKEFAKEKRQNRAAVGGVEDTWDGSQELQLADQVVSADSLFPSDQSERFLDRRQAFMVQRAYAWMRGMFRDSVLREQSLEELFEVLKGREIQLAATPAILPVNGWVTSHFGHRIDPFTERRVFHRGIDVAARIGAPVVAPAEAVVTFANSNGGYGRTIMLFHGYGISTIYAHLNDIHVKEGQRVSRGELIGTVGNTGRSTGAHLHYEVIVHGVHVDPRKFILDRSL